MTHCPSTETFDTDLVDHSEHDDQLPPVPASISAWWKALSAFFQNEDLATHVTTGFNKILAQEMQEVDHMMTGYEQRRFIEYAETQMEHLAQDMLSNMNAAAHKKFDTIESFVQHFAEMKDRLVLQ